MDEAVCPQQFRTVVAGREWQSGLSAVRSAWLFLYPLHFQVCASLLCKLGRCGHNTLGRDGTPWE